MRQKDGKPEASLEYTVSSKLSSPGLHKIPQVLVLEAYVTHLVFCFFYKFIYFIYFCSAGDLTPRLEAEVGGAQQVQGHPRLSNKIVSK